MKRFSVLNSLAVLFVFSLMVWGLVPSAVEGAVPQLINFQGVLKTPADTVVSDDSYSVTFTIYDAPTGGNNLWTETQSVTTTDGLFAVLLGSSNPIPDTAFKGQDRWLGVAVSSDPEMIPRQRLASVGYSYRVSSVNGASGGTISGDLTLLGGNLNLEHSSATVGNIFKGGALFIHDFGTSNTFIGRNAGNLTTSGIANTASGAGALQFNTTGSSNTASGISALQNNTTGSANTASGAGALGSNTTGSSNTASGISALQNNTTGLGNTASGVYALQSNTTGNNNTASGINALFSNTTGSGNTASGNGALASNSTGDGNTASGAFALINNSTGRNNTASGTGALANNTIGYYNTASGYNALQNNAIGYYNTASGYNALQNNAIGDSNTASGVVALSSNTTGSNNTALGARANVSAGNLTNATAIGAGAVVNASNKIRLGNSAVTLVETDGNIKVGANDTVFSSNFSSNSPLSLQAPAGTTRMYIDDVSGNVGIGTASPSEKLDVAGNIQTTGFKMPTGAANGLVLTSDAIGNGTWQAAGGGSGGWTDDGATVRLTTSTDNVGIGTTSPASKLDIVGGNFNLENSTASAGNILKGGDLFIHNIGTDNVFIGRNAGNLTMSGSFNTADGAFALPFNTTGSSNTASGRSALQNNTTGGNNTASGYGALLSNTTGSDNTAIGAGANVSTGNMTNATAIGAGAVVNASNKIRLGNAAVTVIEGQVAYTFPSDKNQKENFRPVDGNEVLRKIQNFNLTSWNYKGHDPKEFRHYGPMAQDFFAAFGDDGVGKIGTETTINSGDMAGILMIAVQALGEENALLKARIEALEKLQAMRR